MALAPEKILARNALIAERGKETRLKRQGQDAKTRELKIPLKRLKPAQREALARVFLEAKWLRNAALASDNWKNFDYKTASVTVKTPTGIEQRQLTTLGSHLRQAVLEELTWNVKSLAALKKRGKKVGGLRYTSEVKSVALKQVGVTYKVDLELKRARVQGIPGWLPLLGVQQLGGLELASAKLVKRPSGYYLLVTGFRAKTAPTEAKLPSIGVDMGVATHFTLSDGSEHNSLIQEPLRLRRLQRKLNRQVKGSKNHGKTRGLLQREYEKMDNRKTELANQLVSKLKQHEAVYFQDENLAQWKRQWGRRIHHSSLGRVKAKLQVLDSAVMLDRWVPTTQYCRECGTRTKYSLDQRIFQCAGCGYTKQRDVHAAINMVWLGQKQVTGQELSGAPVDRKAAVGTSKLVPVSHAGLKRETSTLKKTESGKAAVSLPPKRHDLQSCP